jgi:hypothetical protein
MSRITDLKIPFSLFYVLMAYLTMLSVYDILHCRFLNIIFFPLAFHFGLLDLRHSVGHLGRVISSSQGLSLPLHKHSKTHIHT